MFPARASELQACMWGLTIKNIPAVNRTEDVRSGSPARDCAGAWGSEMVQCALELRGWRGSDLAPRHLPTSNESEGHGLVTHSFIDSLHVEPPSLCPDEAQWLQCHHSSASVSTPLPGDEPVLGLTPRDPHLQHLRRSPQRKLRDLKGTDSSAGRHPANRPGQVSLALH